MATLTNATGQPAKSALRHEDAIPGPDWTWLVILLALLAAAAAGWWLWRRWRRKPGAGAAVLLIPPHRLARDRLRQAAAAMSDPYLFCGAISAIIREYIEGRFALHAPDRTTEEFMGEIRNHSTLADRHKASLESFLGACDMVKFAKAEPTLPELTQLLRVAERFVEETAPVESESSATGRGVA
jgi:hypothetical protein